MPVHVLNPEGLPTPQGYAQVSVSTGTRTVHVAGQVARTADGAQVGPGDLAAQTAQAMRNVATALTAAGGTLDDVVKLTVYVVDLTTDKLGPFMEGVGRASADIGAVPARPATVVGVAALAEPDLLVEIEAVAVLA